MQPALEDLLQGLTAEEVQALFGPSMGPGALAGAAGAEQNGLGALRAPHFAGYAAAPATLQDAAILVRRSECGEPARGRTFTCRLWAMSGFSACRWEWETG
jgi:hypothetical protein